MIRIAATVLLATLASGEARAQPLAPSTPLLRESPLTTLLQPQKLDRSRSLLRQDGDGSGSSESAPNRVTPCTRQGRAAAPAPSVFGGGSGPGDYGHYLPNASASTAPSTAAAKSGTTPASAPAPNGAAPAARASSVDRPLLGGTDRPLWDTGDRRPGPTGKPAQSSDTDKTTDAAPANGPPAPVRDRPLWADGSLMASTDPAAGAGIAPAPCIDPVPPVPR